jgi:hypothetical protein
MSGFTAAETSRTVPVPTLAKIYEHHAEECTRAAERTDDPVFRRVLLMLALQWGQREAGKTAMQRCSVGAGRQRLATAFA